MKRGIQKTSRYAEKEVKWPRKVRCRCGDFVGAKRLRGLALCRECMYAYLSLQVAEKRDAVNAARRALRRARGLRKPGPAPDSSSQRGKLRTSRQSGVGIGKIPYQISTEIIENRGFSL